MSIRSVDAVERSVHKTNEWVKAMAAELGTDDREDAWRLLRADLQVLRDELTVDEAAQLAAQLPMVLRGAFWEGFDPGHQPQKLRHREEFLARVAERAQLADLTEAARAAQATTRVLSEHITEGELDDVFSQLPGEVRAAVQMH
ncbi:MAG: DUF2267 domain-containing protein [Thermoleophilaceae bacterium]